MFALSSIYLSFIAHVSVRCCQLSTVALPVSFSIAFTCIVGSRLMLNIRAKSYKERNKTIDTNAFNNLSEKVLGRLKLDSESPV